MKFGKKMVDFDKSKMHLYSNINNLTIEKEVF